MAIYSHKSLWPYSWCCYLPWSIVISNFVKGQKLYQSKNTITCTYQQRFLQHQEVPPLALEIWVQKWLYGQLKLWAYLFTVLYFVWISDVATVVGFSVVSRPFLSTSSTRHINSTHSERMEVSWTQVANIPLYWEWINFLCHECGAKKTLRSSTCGASSVLYSQPSPEHVS